MMAGNPKLAFSAAISYVVTSIFNAVLVVVKENKSTGVFDWLKNTFGHHWVGHGIVTLIVFILVTVIGVFLFKIEELDDKTVNLLIALIFISTLISVGIIAGFFLMEL